MNDDSIKNPPPFDGTQGTQGTQVDLGEDLLAPTKVTTPIPPGRDFISESFTTHTPDDQYESARILIGEGLVEDAKKILRRILIADPHHTAASESLREILEREMKELLSEVSPVRKPRIFERKGKEARAPQATSDEVIRELDEEFGLGVLSPAPGEPEPPSIEVSLTDATEKDRVDLGIAFLEMGIFAQAIENFRAARETLEVREDADPRPLISVTALLARAYILAGQPFEATLVLHPVLRDGDVQPDDKIEFFYLMGLAEEKLGKRKAALPWYNKVRELDPSYRDISERLRERPKRSGD